jgi:hypothetical protein
MLRKVRTIPENLKMDIIERRGLLNMFKKKSGDWNWTRHNLIMWTTRDAPPFATPVSIEYYDFSPEEYCRHVWRLMSDDDKFKIMNDE